MNIISETGQITAVADGDALFDHLSSTMDIDDYAEPLPPTVDAVRADALAVIDRRSSTISSSYRPPSRAHIYARKSDEAVRLLAKASKGDAKSNDYPYLTASMTAGAGLRETALAVVRRADACDAMDVAVEVLRIAAKQAATAAKTSGEIDEIVGRYIEDLERFWAAFAPQN